MSESSKRWRENNRERWNEYMRELMRERRAAGLVYVDPEDNRERQRRYRESHPAEIADKNAERTATEAQQTPSWPWVKPWRTKLIYDYCPADHHVDHIYPILGPKVPIFGRKIHGFHAPFNLQRLPANDNSSKGNQMPTAATTGRSSPHPVSNTTIDANARVAHISPMRNNNNNDDADDNARRLPTFDAKRLSNEFRGPNGTRQQTPPRMPSRAIAVKAAELRASMRINPLDYSDLHERFVDLWQEARQVIWRAKHSKAGQKIIDPTTGKQTLTFIVDEKLVLQAIDTTKGILDSLLKLRRQMGHETNQIPRWAIERIESALRDHPAALKALLRDLAPNLDDD
jgi:hypothetical protein